MLNFTQVNLVQQQVLKTRKWLSTPTSKSSATFPPRDPNWAAMWYIVSVNSSFQYELFKYYANKYNLFSNFLQLSIKIVNRKTALFQNLKVDFW